MDINSIIQITIDNVPGHSYQDKLNHLANCHCCNRHQVNKPTVFQPWHETPFNNTLNIHPCMCNCRLISRFICRQANYTPLSRTNSPNSVLHF